MEGVPGWQTHMQGLADQGFFQDHPTGSPAHTRLMQQAAASFRATETYAAHRAAAHEPAARILELAQRPFDPSKVLFVPSWDCLQLMQLTAGIDVSVGWLVQPENVRGWNEQNFMKRSLDHS